MADTEGNRTGDGKTSPFGNGKGATMAGASSGGNDFTKNPSGSGSKEGGNDFTRNPGGNSNKSGGRDFTKEAPNKQKSGDAPDLNTDGSPGERFPKVGPRPGAPDVGCGTLGDSRKPYRVGK